MFGALLQMTEYEIILVSCEVRSWRRRENIRLCLLSRPNWVVTVPGRTA
jgi:hypothetical protein